MCSNLNQNSFATSIQDVGASINKCANRTLVREGLLFLGNSVAHATHPEVDSLQGKHKIVTVIDADPDDSSQSILNTHHFSGLRYIRASLMSPAYVKLIRSRLSYRAVCKITMHIFSMSLNSPAAREIINEVIQARGPILESLDVLDTAGEQIRELFTSVLSNAYAYPILVCGRTMMRRQNLLALLILLLLEIPVECIQHHYAESIDGLQSGPTISASEQNFVTAIQTTKKDWVSATKRHLDNKYGGVELYLAGIGVTVRQRSAVREALRYDVKETLVDL